MLCMFRTHAMHFVELSTACFECAPKAVYLMLALMPQGREHGASG